MSTFLELSKKAARDSGVISGTNPATVTGQTGDNLRIVNAVIEAWKNIQNRQDGWLWMKKYFDDKATIASTARYTAASWSITDHAAWIVDSREPPQLYLTATGVSDEGPLRWIPWAEYVRKYVRGEQDENRPGEYSISPAGEFCLGQIPDAVYSVSGIYRQETVILAANEDTPGMPTRFHDLIAHEAVMIFNGLDEALTAFADAKRKADAMWPLLVRDQLEKITFAGGPIA